MKQNELVQIDQLLSAQASALLLGMSPRNFHYYLKAGTGPNPVSVGGRKMYVAGEVLEWVKTINRQPRKGRKNGHLAKG